MRRIKKPECLKTVHGRAPLRVNDIGGWTDTWFARKGKVLNLAVLPGIEVQVKAYENKERSAKRILLRAENYGRPFLMDPEKPGFDRHPLLQFAVASVPVPEDLRLDIAIRSLVPPAISTGTSAAVCVALIGILSFLSSRPLPLNRLAGLAHEVETEKLKQQSGIQDQISEAYGGVCFIDIYDYPRFRVERLTLENRVREELGRRICLVAFGRRHRSSSLHERVIRSLERGKNSFEQIDKMKALAAEGRGHILRGDLEAYGEIMIRNNECQRSLHPGLISKEADSVIGVARRYGASGWKVNGAGGKGGSITLLGPEDDTLRRRMLRKIDDLSRGIRVLPMHLSDSGFTAWENPEFHAKDSARLFV